MKRLTLLAVIAALFVSAILPAQAQGPNYTKITYIHSDADGSPFAATDEQGNLEWHIDHYPYGDEYRNTEIARKSNLSFAGKAYDEEIGLSYFGGRWYDPAAGRFMSIDPAPVDPEDYRTFNRYAYGFNNPYKYVDPDGNLPILIPLAIFIAKEIAAEGASRATGGLTDFLSVRRLGTKAIKKGVGFFKRKSNAKKMGGRGKQLGNSIKMDGSTPASEIKGKAESLGFKPVQSANGPLKLVDENGVARATIKGGSQRAPRSGNPHVELKTSSGQRVNPAGQPVTRKSPENHTPIINDL